MKELKEEQLLFLENSIRALALECGLFGRTHPIRNKGGQVLL